jgi:1-acyl-sn-glycerol-3-phosphate acyltransferase
MLPQWVLELVRPVVRVFSMLLWRARWINTEYIPQSGGVIIASNHQTYLDPFWLSCPLKRPVRYLAWDEAFTWPIVGYGLRLLGAWPLQLEGSDPAPIRRSLQFISEGGAVVIFPEGGRGNADGSMRRFKPGAVRMAMESGVPILPVTIHGGNLIWPPGRKFPRLGHVKITYHPLFVVTQNGSDDQRAYARSATQELQKIIAADTDSSLDNSTPS